MSEKKDSNATKDVFITDLTIHKVRHLKDIHIPLSKTERKHLILTGKNGSGKTSVLESLKDSVWERCKGGGGVLQPSDRRDGGWEVVQKDEKSKKLSIRFNYLKKIEEYYEAGNFIATFYGAERLAMMKAPKGVEKINLRDKYDYKHESPGKEFIQYIVNLKAEKSFARDDQDHETVNNIENWFEMFENSLKKIFEDSSLRLEFDRNNYNFIIHQKGKELFDFNTLADGYSAIINVLTDLILRMEKHKTKSYDVQGVVLIDELETHLHIDLQKMVFPFLTGFFPRVQFIVTTHSPFILNSIENSVIYDLEKNLLVEDLSGYSYNGIIDGYFGNDEYSEIIKGKIEMYEDLVNKEKRTEAEEDWMIELRRYLKNIPGSLSPQLKVKFQQIELKRMKKNND